MNNTENVDKISIFSAGLSSAVFVSATIDCCMYSLHYTTHTLCTVHDSFVRSNFMIVVKEPSKKKKYKDCIFDLRFCSFESVWGNRSQSVFDNPFSSRFFSPMTNKAIELVDEPVAPRRTTYLFQTKKNRKKCITALNWTTVNDEIINEMGIQYMLLLYVERKGNRAGMVSNLKSWLNFFTCILHYFVWVLKRTADRFFISFAS